MRATLYSTRDLTRIFSFSIYVVAPGIYLLKANMTGEYKPLDISYYTGAVEDDPYLSKDDDVQHIRKEKYEEDKEKLNIAHKEFLANQGRW